MLTARRAPAELGDAQVVRLPARPVPPSLAVPPAQLPLGSRVVGINGEEETAPEAVLVVRFGGEKGPC